MSTMLEREFADIRERLQQTEVQLHQERKARKQLEKMVGEQINFYCKQYGLGCLNFGHLHLMKVS